MTRNMLPPKNIRRVHPHVCAFCREFRDGDGSWECLRDEDAPTGDTGDGHQYFTTCDRWRTDNPKTNRKDA